MNAEAVRDIRFEAPLYTVPEAARFLKVPTTTLNTWAKGYVRHPSGRPVVRGERIISSFDAPRNYPSIPFVGLAEGMVLAAFRRGGMSMQYIRKAVAILDEEIGITNALASKRLYADGPRILFDYAHAQLNRDGEFAGLTEVVSQQRVFAPVVQDYLERIDYAADGWAESVAWPGTRGRIVIADPLRAFGQPIFAHGGAPVESVVGRWKAGEELKKVAKDFGVPLADVEDYLRAAFPLAS